MKAKTTLRKAGLVLVSLLLGSNIFAQICTPDPMYTNPGIWPDTTVNMDPACIGSNYQMDFTMVVPDDTVVSGFTFIIDSVILNSITGLPSGFTYSCGSSSCRFLGNAAGCFIISGVPTIALTGSYNLTINTTVYAHNSVLGNQFLPQQFQGYQLNIGSNPIVGTNTDDASCGMNDGMAYALATGSGPFEYLWSDSTTNDTLFNVPAGLYQVTVTDNIGCTSTANATVVNPGAPSIDSVTSVNPNCFGDTDGSATVFVSGGTPTYNYSWTSGGNLATETNLGMGNYTVTVTDGANCATSSLVSITTPPAIGTSTSVTPETCAGCMDGTASVNASGGTPGYTYNWTPSGGTSSNATGLATGVYTITVTDSAGCVATNTANVYSTAGINEASANDWKIFPNPTVEELNIQGTFFEKTTVHISDMSGRTVESIVFIGGNYKIQTMNWSPGVFIVEIDNAGTRKTFKLLKQ